MSGPAPRPLLDRLLDKIDVRGPEECWPALTPIDPTKGYPYISIGSRTDGTRRRVNLMAAVYDELVGDRPADKPHTDHLCHAWTAIPCELGVACPHRACCNPDHLEAVTIVDNVMRGNGFAARRARSNVCARGHAFTEANTIIENTRGRAPYRRCRTCRSA